MDRWDGIGFFGFALVLVGVAFIFWPLALILGGCGTIGLYLLRERAHAAQSASRR